MSVQAHSTGGDVLPTLPMLKVDHAAPVAHVGPYRLTELLGVGATGRVWLGVNSNKGQKVAIKIICKSDLELDKELNEKVEREIAIMKLINHPHVLALFDVYESQHNLYVGVAQGEVSWIEKMVIGLGQM